MSKVLGKQAEEIAGQVEHWIDGYIQNLIENNYNKKRKVVSLLKTYKIKKSDSKKLCMWFTSLKNELEEAITEKDPDLVEGYNFLSPVKLKKLFEFVSGICEDFDNHAKITKKKKKRNPDTVVKNLKFMDKTILNKIEINSFDPTKILKCKSFLVYNTKTSDISYYITDDSFDIKGTTIQNYNPDISFVKKIGRSANKLVPSLVSGGYASVLNDVKKVNTKSRAVTGRINQYTILLRTLT